MSFWHTANTNFLTFSINLNTIRANHIKMMLFHVRDLFFKTTGDTNIIRIHSEEIFNIIPAFFDYVFNNTVHRKRQPFINLIN